MVFPGKLMELEKYHPNSTLLEVTQDSNMVCTNLKMDISCLVKNNHATIQTKRSQATRSA